MKSDRKTWNKNAITIVELIVVVTILSILGTIAFISFQSFTKSARDTVRTMDTKSIKKALVYTYTYNNVYPEPSNTTSINYKGGEVWTQGTFGSDTRRATDILDKVPTDPLFASEYTYSVTKDRKEYEIAGISENESLAMNINIGNTAHAANEGLITVIEGNYNGLLLKTTTGGVDYIVTSPSIIASDLSDSSFTNIIENNNIAFDKYSTFPHSFGGTTTENLFSPNVNNVEVYSGSLDSLDFQNNQVTLLQNLQEAYSGSSLGNDIILISKLEGLEIDTENPSNTVTTIACNLVNHQLKQYNECSGVNFITFFVTEILNIDISNIAGTNITSVYQDTAGNLWFGTDDGGISLFDGENWVYYNKDNSGLVNDELWSIVEDNDNLLWFGTSGGISTFNPDDDSWDSITTSNSDLLHNHILYIYTSSSGTMWIGTNKGISTYDSDTWSAYTKKQTGISHNHVSTIFEDSNEDIWLGTVRGLDRFTPSNENLITYNSSNSNPNIPSNGYTFILEDSNKNLFVGTDSGLAVYNITGDSWSHHTVANSGGGLIGDTITYIFIDNQGKLWVGTTDGASKYNILTNTWEANYSTSNELDGNHIYNITNNDDGDIIILSDGGLNTITP